MNLRPSTSILASTLSEPSGPTEPSAFSSRSLRRRFLSLAGIVSLVVLAGGGYGGLVVLRKSIAGDEDARIVYSASLSKQLVDRVLEERARQVDLIASSPAVLAAARKGAEVSRSRGLVTMPIARLEEMFKATRSQQVDDGARQYLATLLPKLDIAEIMVTDEFGYNAVTTSPSSDFVQSDEGWWQTAWNSGQTTAQATADAATQRTVVELARVIRDGNARAGVVKVKFGLSVVDSVLSQGTAGGNGIRVDLLDSAGKVIASSGVAARFKVFRAAAPVAAATPGSTFAFMTDSTRRGSVALTNGSHWRVVSHMSEEDASHTYHVARTFLILGIIVMLGLLVTSVYFVSGFIERRITNPAAKLARAAEAVAAGDLSTRVDDIGGFDDEIGRLARAISAMIDELRRLAVALNQSSSETATMTTEITASTEEMAASAGQIAHTAADLSQQASQMAAMIQTLAAASDHLVGIAGELETGASEGVRRNEHLRTLALDNRSRLDESAQSLVGLSGDVEASAAAIEGLAQASEEVRTFVTLVQKLARQSKLLALNAAMEAARAGEHGHGFAVVAEEVRRLAAMSSDAAERTEQVVSGVLRGVEASRSTSARTVDTVRAVRGVTENASRSFGEIETAVAEADGWTATIAGAATTANGLVHEMQQKLESMSAGTESFAAAMQEVAASSEEQSASTEEIAAAAATLSGAAERLSRLVANLRLDETPAPPNGGPTPPSTQPQRPAPIAGGRLAPVRNPVTA
jgi:methyl-accepting chemotaxis protein